MTTLQEWLEPRVGRGGGKISGAELARRAKLSEGYVSQLRRGLREGREADTRRRIAQAFRIPYEQLLRELGEVERSTKAASDVERAIREDPDLTPSQAKILLDAYRELRGRR